VTRRTLPLKRADSFIVSVRISSVIRGCSGISLQTTSRQGKRFFIQKKLDMPLLICQSLFASADLLLRLRKQNLNIEDFLWKMCAKRGEMGLQKRNGKTVQSLAQGTAGEWRDFRGANEHPGFPAAPAKFNLSPRPHSN